LGVGVWVEKRRALRKSVCVVRRCWAVPWNAFIWWAVGGYVDECWKAVRGKREEMRLTDTD
jgi:hypothetical protein